MIRFSRLSRLPSSDPGVSNAIGIETLPSAGRWLLLGAALAAIAVVAGLASAPAGIGDAMFMEGEPVEMLQDWALAAGIAVFALTAWKSSDARVVYCLVAAFAVTFALVRETPRCGSAYAGDGTCLTETWKLAVMLSASGLTLLALLVRRVPWRTALHLSHLRWAWPSIVVLVLVAASQIFDKSATVEIEEPLELAAYLYLLCFALWMLGQSRRGA